MCARVCRASLPSSFEIEIEKRKRGRGERLRRKGSIAVVSKREAKCDELLGSDVEIKQLSGRTWCDEAQLKRAVAGCVCEVGLWDDVGEISVIRYFYTAHQSAKTYWRFEGSVKHVCARCRYFVFETRFEVSNYRLDMC